MSLSFLRLSLRERWSGVVKWERGLVISCGAKVPMLDDFDGEQSETQKFVTAARGSLVIRIGIWNQTGIPHILEQPFSIKTNNQRISRSVTNPVIGYQRVHRQNNRNIVNTSDARQVPPDLWFLHDQLLAYIYSQ